MFYLHYVKIYLINSSRLTNQVFLSNFQTILHGTEWVGSEIAGMLILWCEIECYFYTHRNHISTLMQFVCLQHAAYQIFICINGNCNIEFGKYHVHLLGSGLVLTWIAFVLVIQAECNPETCTQMTATEQWIFLCAAHKTPKEASLEYNALHRQWLKYTTTTTLYKLTVLYKMGTISQAYTVHVLVY